MHRLELSDIDDNDIDDIIEEQRRKAPIFYDDVSEFSETQSVMSMQTITGQVDYIPPDCDLDQYIDDMLKNKNKRMMKQMEMQHDQKL